MVHCLTNKRNLSSYKVLIKFLRQQIQFVSPNYLILDFESSSYEALRALFLKTKLYGCLFHLAQIICSRIQFFDYSGIYKKSFTFKVNIIMINSFAFFPLEYVDKGINILKN